MKLFVDTNWLVAAYFAEKFPTNSAIVEKFASRNDYPWFISHAVLAECSTVFRYLAGEQNPPQWIRFQKNLRESIHLSADSWDVTSVRADELIRQYAHKARLGTMDLMILAAAQNASATHFLSFDTNSNLRALAAVLKFKVFPELTTNDKRRMAALR